MAATFVNLKTNRLYRVLSTEASRDLCDVYAPEITDRAVAIAARNGGVLQVLSLKLGYAGMVITGNEVFNGLITDKFAPILQKKVTDLGSAVSGIVFARMMLFLSSRQSSPIWQTGVS